MYHTRLQVICDPEYAEILMAEIAETGFDSFLETDKGFEAYVENVKPWDIAAASLIVREAGGQTTCGSAPSVYPSDINGDGFIASNGVIHGKLRELLVSHHGSRNKN
mgnify:CR=1 FL=1